MKNGKMLPTNCKKNERNHKTKLLKLLKITNKCIDFGLYLYCISTEIDLNFKYLWEKINIYLSKEFTNNILGIIVYLMCRSMKNR